MNIEICELNLTCSCGTQVKIQTVGIEPTQSALFLSGKCDMCGEDAFDMKSLETLTLYAERILCGGLQ